MLASRHRLKQTRDINRVYARGRFGGAPDLTAKALSNHQAYSRAVVVVGKKISKRAVVRNLIRRRTAAQLAGIWKTVLPGYDIVITVRADLSTSPSPELVHQLTGALHRAGVLAKSNPTFK